MSRSSEILGFYPDLILEQPDVVVRSLRVDFGLSLQVQLQSLHVEPEVSGVGVALRRVAEEHRRQRR